MVKITRLKDRLYMSPMKKYEVYGKFPWKLIIQVLLVTFTTCQTLLIANPSTTYSYSQYTLWNKLFLNKDVQRSDTTITNSYNIFGIKSLHAYIQTTVDRYFDINSYTIDDYEFKYNSDGSKKAPKLLVEYFDNDKALNSNFSLEYTLYQNNLGPFENVNVQDYLQQVKRFEIRFTLIHKVDKYSNLASSCYEWDIVQKYDYSTHGTIGTTLSPDRVACNNPDCIVYLDNVLKNYLWVDFVVIILAIASLGTIVNYIRKRLEIFGQLTGDGHGFRSNWENLGISEKLKFFNFWVMIAVAGNLFQIFGGILSILERNTILSVHEIVIGFGCFFAWIGIVRFLNHTSHSYTIVNTMGRSAETIGFYIIGVVPIFMGYAFCGICLFWQTGIYPNTPMSMIANFAVVNGDSVYLFSDAGYQETAFIGQLYYYTFIVFFIW